MNRFWILASITTLILQTTSCTSTQTKRDPAAVTEKLGQKSYLRDLKTGFHEGDEIRLYVETHSSAKDHHNILVLGDSITVSDCVIFGNPSPDSRCGWRRNLSQECGHDEDYYSFDTLARVGISARQVANELELPAPRFSRKLKNGQVIDPGISADFIYRKKYEAVLVALGTNDADTTSDSFKESIRGSYEKIARVLRQRMVGSPRIIFISPLPSCRNENFRKNIVKANEVIREIVASQKTKKSADTSSELNLNNFGRIDIYQTFNSDVNLGCMQEGMGATDLLHPSNGRATQGKIAHAIARAQFENGRAVIPGCEPKN